MTVPSKPSNPHRDPLRVVAINIMNVKMVREEDIKEVAAEVVILIVVEINKIVVAITTKMANNKDGKQQDIPNKASKQKLLFVCSSKVLFD